MKTKQQHLNVIALFILTLGATFLAVSCGREAHDQRTLSFHTPPEHRPIAREFSPDDRPEFNLANEIPTATGTGSPSPHYFYAGNYRSSHGFGAEWYRNTGDLHWLYVVKCGGVIKAFFWKSQKAKCDERYENKSVLFTEDPVAGLTSDSLKINWSEIARFKDHYKFVSKEALIFDYLHRTSLWGDRETFKFEFWVQSAKGSVFVWQSGFYAWINGRPWLICKFVDRNQIDSASKVLEPFIATDYRLAKTMSGKSPEHYRDIGSSYGAPNVEFVYSTSAAENYKVQSTQAINFEGQNLMVELLSLSFEGTGTRPECTLNTGSNRMAGLFCWWYENVSYQKVSVIEKATGRVLVGAAKIAELFGSKEVSVNWNRDEHYTFCMSTDTFGGSAAQVFVDGRESYTMRGVFYDGFCRIVFLPNRAAGRTYKITMRNAQNKIQDVGLFRLDPESTAPASVYSQVSNGSIRLLGVKSSKETLKVNGQTCRWATLNDLPGLPKTANLNFNSLARSRAYPVDQEFTSCSLSTTALKALVDDGSTRVQIEPPSPNFQGNPDFYQSQRWYLVAKAKVTLDDRKLGKSDLLPITFDRFYLSNLLKTSTVGIPKGFSHGWLFRKEQDSLLIESSLLGSRYDNWVMTPLGWLADTGSVTYLYNTKQKLLPIGSHGGLIEEYLTENNVRDAAFIRETFVRNMHGRGMESEIWVAGRNLQLIKSMEWKRKISDPYESCTISESLTGGSRSDFNTLACNIVLTESEKTNGAEFPFLHVKATLKDGTVIVTTAIAELTRGMGLRLIDSDRDPELKLYTLVEGISFAPTTTASLGDVRCYAYSSPSLNGCIAKTEISRPGSRLLVIREDDVVIYRGVVGKDPVSNETSQIRTIRPTLVVNIPDKAEYFYDGGVPRDYKTTVEPINFYTTPDPYLRPLGLKSIKVNGTTCPLVGAEEVKIFNAPSGFVRSFSWGGYCNFAKFLTMNRYDVVPFTPKNVDFGYADASSENFELDRMGAFGPNPLWHDPKSKISFVPDDGLGGPQSMHPSTGFRSCQNICAKRGLMHLPSDNNESQCRNFFSLSAIHGALAGLAKDAYEANFAKAGLGCTSHNRDSNQRFLFGFITQNVTTWENPDESVISTTYGPKDNSLRNKVCPCRSQ